jgi:YidC/Oxa1 family membrane protein insertase
MDRNSVIGFTLLALMLIGYLSYNNYSQSQFEAKKKADSVAYAKAHPPKPIDSSRLQQAVVPARDSAAEASLAAMPPAFRGTAQNLTLENKDIALTFTTKGAYPTAAHLKNYKTYEGKPLYIFNGPDNKLSAIIPSGSGMAATSDLMFTPTMQGPQKVDFTADLGDGKRIDLIYTLPTEGYMVQCDIRLNGIAVSSLPLRWNTQSLHTERDINSERQNAQVHYRDKNKDHDYWTVTSDEIHKTPQDAPSQWLGFRMHYFSTALIAENGFTKTEIKASAKPDSNIIATSSFAMELPVNGDGTASMRWFIGPNQYRLLKNYQIGLDEMVPLGSGIFFFVKYINQWMIIPVFDFLTGFISNYGVIIMVLTLFIKLILSFFTYKSYLSSAKMRVLKPELDELRGKYGEDQQRMSMEQMKLYRSAGVSPLGGCLPTLFMMPFLVAMYYFFPAAIDFRQESFLWSHDLSTYDSIATLPFSFFDHISLFTLLMTASSLFLALYNRNMTPQDPNNPMMKWMPFIFPIILLGVFNKMAAALTFYYFFSNMVSIAQQFIIQKLFINEEKIHAQLKENRLKPATPSKWQQRIEEMQKANADRVKANNKPASKK